MILNPREELRQQKPFTSVQQEAFLNIGRTEAVLHDAFERMLKPYAVSATQYNVLRILRGAGPEGLCRNEIRDRLLTRTPDVTRLLDRMEDAGLVDALDSPVAVEHQRRLGHLTDN